MKVDGQAFPRLNRPRRQTALVIGMGSLLVLASVRSGYGQELFWSELGPSCNGDLVRHWSPGAATIDDLITSAGYLPKLVVDPAARQLYWSDAGSGGGTIRRGSLDRLDLADLVTVSSPYSLQGFTLDLTNGHIYWMEGVGCSPCGGVGCSECPRIRRAKLDGTDVETVTTIDTGGFTNPADVAVDPQGGKLYWSDRQFPPFVSRSNLDGSNPEPLVTTTQSVGGVNDLALDVAAGKMYWTEADGFVPGNNGVSRSNLDGSDYEPLVTYVSSMNFPRGLSLDPACGKFYWTLGGFCSDGTGALLRSNLDAPNVENLVTGLGITLAIAVAPGSGTLPCGTQCTRAVTFESLGCRLTELQGQMSRASGLGQLQTGLIGKVAKASSKLTQAETSCAQGKLPPVRKGLGSASHLMNATAAKMGSRRGRQIIDPALSAELLGAITPIHEDLDELRSSVTCP